MTFPNNFLFDPSILIDDSDPNIRYTGGWTVVPDATNEGLISRAPIFNTLHVLPVFNGTLSYDFIGTGISLFTTTNALFRNYSAECFVDGTPVETSLEPSNYGQNKAICAAFGLPDGVLHALTLSISVLPLNADQSSEIFSGFCFDYILVQPSPSMSLAGSNLFIDFMVDEGPSNLTPNSFNFVSRAFQGASGSTGWIFRSGSGFQTSNQGSQLNVSFTGVGILWYGYHTTDMPFNVLSSATLEIDEGPPRLFAPGPLVTSYDDGIPSGNSLNEAGPIPFFNTSTLHNSSHTLTVTYNGANTSHPLTLSSLVIQRSPNTTSTALANHSTSSMSSLSSRPTLPAPSDSPHARISTGRVAGGIAGGFTLLLLLSISSWLLYIRWKKRRAEFMSNNMGVHLKAFRTPTGRDTTIITPRKVRTSQQQIAHPLTQELENPPITKWARHPVLENAAQAPVAQVGGSTSHCPISTRPVSIGSTALTHAATPAQDRLREEDSGLRLSPQGHARTLMLTLPPSYTMY